MSSMSRLGIGLSVVFGCFLLALVAELYYVFCWRRRQSSGSALNGEVEDEYSSPSRELFYLLCWKKQRTSTSTRGLDNHLRHREANGSYQHHRDDAMLVQRSQDQSTDFVAKFFPAEGMDSELMRIHNLLGPPRILFTIKEETKEDLDSEDGRSRKSRRGSRSRSLSDLLSQMSVAAVASGTVTPIDNTPFVTPPSSPPFCTPMATPPLTPLTPLHNTLFPRLSAVHNKQHHQHLTEDSRSISSSSSSSASSSLASSFPSSFTSSASHSPFISPPPCTTLHTLPNQGNCILHPVKEGHLPLSARLQQSPIKGDLYPNTIGFASPPPKFKFMRDAELKAAKTTAMELNKKQQQQQHEPAPPSPLSSSPVSSDEDGSFITIIVGDSNSSSSSLVHHPSPVSTVNPTGHIMSLSPSSPCISPLFSPLTGIHMNIPTDPTHK
ncbi:hypothetical protein SUGI_0045490 [Cryptomeria japonica]|nr:hypothetical protein SUGI_0045490 [Cryptomeria japonica]